MGLQNIFWTKHNLKLYGIIMVLNIIWIKQHEIVVLNLSPHDHHVLTSYINCIEQANGSESTMSDTNAIVRSEVVETGFGFYFDKDIKHLSCCKITSTLTEDALGHSLPKWVVSFINVTLNLHFLIVIILYLILCSLVVCTTWDLEQLISKQIVKLVR